MRSLAISSQATKCSSQQSISFLENHFFKHSSWGAVERFACHLHFFCHIAFVDGNWSSANYTVLFCFAWLIFTMLLCNMDLVFFWPKDLYYIIIQGFFIYLVRIRYLVQDLIIFGCNASIFSIQSSDFEDTLLGWIAERVPSIIWAFRCTKTTAMARYFLQDWKICRMI
jgi:hypothetical protein